ncbi:FAD-binding oxidoreductase [Kribbella qitaiheensis]|uniref:FAD-binding oxidoreductase n=1 Tax=Kribbella qitaiheensis TaxID=1544730 RepID=UPI003620EAAF
MTSAETFPASKPTRLDDELHRLNASTTGRLVRPSSAEWDEARQAWNLSANLRPTAVAEVASVDDVVTVVNLARRIGLRVAPMSTGHNAGALPNLEGVVLLKLGALRDVIVDAEERTARAGGGARWSDVIEVAAQHGMAALGGTSRDVGVAGYLLGGGMSWLVRSHGPAADYVTAIELVTADGRFRRIDANTEPELFWAVCGGGGSFGVVTALEFDLLPISTVQGGRLLWPIESASQVLHEWQRWIATVPREITSVGRLLSFPPLSAIPEAIRGKAFAVIELVSQLSAERTNELLAPLRALSPSTDTVTELPVSQLWQLHGDPDGPASGTGEGILLDALPAEAVDAMIEAFQPPLVSFELRHLDGAFASAHGGVVEYPDADIAAFAAVIVPSPDELEIARLQVERAVAALTEWAIGRDYLNFAESRKPLDRLFTKEIVDRLRAVRATYDPDSLILANHNVDPA